MKLAKLQQKLLAAARTLRVDDRVPYAFEKGVMARIRDLRPADRWAGWSRLLWQAAVPCVALTVVLSALAVSMPPGGQTAQAPLDVQFETVVYAAMDYPEGSW